MRGSILSVSRVFADTILAEGAAQPEQQSWSFSPFWLFTMTLQC